MFFLCEYLIIKNSTMKNFLVAGMFSMLLVGCGAENIDVSKVPERGFYSTRAASKWEESLVTGNGTMGVMVEGNPFRESVVFNHALLYRLFTNL